MHIIFCLKAGMMGGASRRQAPNAALRLYEDEKKKHSCSGPSNNEDLTLGELENAARKFSHKDNFS